MSDDDVKPVKEKKPRKPRAPKAPAKSTAPPPVGETVAAESKEAKVDTPAEAKKAPAKRAPRATTTKTDPIWEQLDRRFKVCKFVDTQLDHSLVLLDNPKLAEYANAVHILDSAEHHRKRLEDEVDLLSRKKLEPTGHDLGKLCDKLNAVELQAGKVVAQLKRAQAEVLAKDPKAWTPAEKALADENFAPKRNDWEETGSRFQYCNRSF
jgi:hypothetical protein